MNGILKLGSGLRKLTAGVAGKQSFFGNFARYQGIATCNTITDRMLPQSTTVNNKFLLRKSINGQCRCGCGKLYHTDAERNMVEFLDSEIKEERKSQKLPSLPEKLGDFSIKTDGAEMRLEKKTDKETVRLSFSVNDSVDTEDPEGEENEMRSRPCFDVEIQRKDSILRFSCSYVQYVDDEDKGDVYQIDEVSLYKGDRNEKNYTIAADILDEKLYDLFMTLLIEKGISNDFMEQVSDVATHFEHFKYISLLEGIQKFSSAN